MIGRGAAAMLALALLVVPAARAAGPVIGYSVSSGTPGDAGWYRSAVTAQISVQGASDTTCPSVKTFRTSADVLDCSATDGAANVALRLQFKIDTDAPTVTGYATSRAPDANGWFNRAVTVSFSGADATSGIASCSETTYAGPDAASAVVGGTCRDVAGNASAPGSAELKYDATAPDVAAAAGRAPDGADWYSRPVAVTFAGSDATSGIDACTGSQTFAGPDTAAASLTGSCADRAGNRTSKTLTLKFDGTPPTASGEVARRPDERGWYTRPVKVAFKGTDALSGIATCSAGRTYAGPDDGAVRVRGECRDAAGNAAEAVVPLRYDATAPRLASVKAVTAAGAIQLTWRQPRDVETVSVLRAPGRGGARESLVYRGRAGRVRDGTVRAGVVYRYRLSSRDEAGHGATASVRAELRSLYAPAAGAPARAGDVLRWAPAKGARYYNLQLYREGKKVLSTWPLGASYRLRAAWVFGGRRFRLERGRYRWYVWPGRGPRAAARYGPLIGSSSFVVRSISG